MRHTNVLLGFVFAAAGTAFGQTGYTYHPDAITILTYMAGADDRVETIFLVR